MLGVALEKAHAVTGGLSLAREAPVDIIERGGAIVFRLPRPEQVEVRAVQYQDFGHLGRRYADGRNIYNTR
jgi:hypothetical protein